MKRVSLNIKDPEAHRLARAIASRTGESLTSAVIQALRQRYQQLGAQHPDSLANDLRAIAQRASKHMQRPYADHAEFLYDEHGLPR